MGIVNVTPDSFSDGGRHLEPGAAISHGLRLAETGADLVDVGGESARPGSEGVSARQELSRVIPVVEGLAAAGVSVSIDTSKPEVAAEAIAAGAVVVNDITALASPGMAEVCAEAGVGVVLMHMQGTPRTMQVAPTYHDVVAEVRDFLIERAAMAVAAGIPSTAICIDPGIGFGKTLEHNLTLLARLSDLVETGYPALIGASRKSLLGSLLGGTPPADRDEATDATTALAIVSGVAVVRVHDAARARRTALVLDAIVRANRPGQLLK